MSNAVTAFGQTSGPVVEGRGLVKHYGSIHAVDGIDITIRAGEILAIVGDNGAGKSTLIKMLSGAIEPDRGEILIDGRPRKLRGPNDARASGIEALYQDLALLPNLDVTTNLFLGRETIHGGLIRPLGFMARRRMRRDAAARLDMLQIRIPRLWGTPVESLSGGQRQSVAIARALVWASKVVILDEPTAALGVAQSRAVLDLSARIRETGTSVVIISHILPHVLELADRIVVLRHGHKVADLAAREVTQDRLIALIVGAELGDAGGRPDEAAVGVEDEEVGGVAFGNADPPQ
jgi:simple sugar transport system ATP-binding protein